MSWAFLLVLTAPQRCIYNGCLSTLSPSLFRIPSKSSRSATSEASSAAPSSSWDASTVTSCQLRASKEGPEYHRATDATEPQMSSSSRYVLVLLAPSHMSRHLEHTRYVPSVLRHIFHTDASALCLSGCPRHRSPGLSCRAQVRRVTLHHVLDDRFAD